MTNAKVNSSPVMLALEIGGVILRIIYSIFESIFRLFMPSAEKSVKGEVVLITGTGHGMGKQLALQYAELGATVVCVDINEENNEQTVKEINEKYTNAAHSYTCDVSNFENVKTLAETIKKEVGSVDILVNNAGIMPCKQFFSYKPDEIYKLFGVNVYAHFWLMMNFVPDMLEKNHGHIVSLSSVAGILGVEYLVPYCATKFAVRGMMEAMHEELRTKVKNSNIKMTVIYPYMIDTGLCQKPVIRFPSLLNMIDPKTAAQLIISAQRKNIIEYSIPNYMLLLNYIFRLLPNQAGFLLKDFLGSSLNEHDSE